MTDTLQEAETLVNSKTTSNTSLKDLDANQDQPRSSQANVYRDLLLKHNVFKLYNELYIEHSHQNHHNRLIQENIWPILTGETLIGDGKINFRSNSLYLIDDDFLTRYGDFEQLHPGQNNFSYTFFHVGHKLSGHQKIIHGGLLATILDEITCRLAFQNFHSKKGVTANLNINYKQPCFINTYILIKCSTIKKVGRKCFVRGSVYKIDLDDESLQQPTIDKIETKANLLTECECLVIEPKWVHELENKRLA